MGCTGFNIRGHIAFPMRNDNWHNFTSQLSTETSLQPQCWGQGNSYLSKFNTKKYKNLKK